MCHVPVHGTLLRCVDGSNIGVREEDFLFHLFYRLYIKTAALNLVIINAHESIPYLMMICHDISRPISYEKVRYLITSPKRFTILLISYWGMTLHPTRYPNIVIRDAPTSSSSSHSERCNHISSFSLSHDKRSQYILFAFLVS